MPRIPAITASLQYVHPLARAQFQQLADDLAAAHERGATTTLFIPFESYRTPMRQDELYRQKPPVTKTRAWGSAHQYGLAVDFVAHDDEPWGEHHDWDFLRERAIACGLDMPFKWDRVHVQHPLFVVLQMNLLNK